MLGLAKEFWLNVANSVLGSAILIFVVLVAIGLILDVIRRLTKPSKEDHSVPQEPLGTTLADGGKDTNKSS